MDNYYTIKVSKTAYSMVGEWGKQEEKVDTQEIFNVAVADLDLWALIEVIYGKGKAVTIERIGPTEDEIRAMVKTVFANQQSLRNAETEEKKRRNRKK